MITENTVFILGAGASVPYGFPSGKGLVNKIIDVCESDEVIGASVEDPQKEMLNISEMRQKAKAFKSVLEMGSPASIDEYLEKRPEYLKLGKICIAKIIDECNQGYLSHLRKAELGNENWYGYLKNKMFKKTYEETCENKVSFLTFNYDTSLETYFLDALRSDYGNDRPREFFEKIKIIHIHGKLRKLPWEGGALPYIQTAHTGFGNREGSLTKVYGYEYGTLEIDVTLAQNNLTMANGIRLYHEIGNANAPDEVKSILDSSKRVFFLGFGFHPENVAKVQPTPSLVQPVFYGKSLFSTRYNYTDSEWRGIKKLSGFIQMRVEGGETTNCYQLLRNCAEFLN